MNDEELRVVDAEIDALMAQYGYTYDEPNMQYVNGEMIVSGDFASSMCLKLKQSKFRDQQIALAAQEIDGSTSDGHHTFNELYEYRMLYNALLFNEWAKQDKYDVHLSYRHSDGEQCFGKDDYFVVVAMLPDGQVSNHYKGKYRHLFYEVPERERAAEYDGHTPQDALKRLHDLAALKQPQGNILNEGEKR